MIIKYKHGSVHFCYPLCYKSQKVALAASRCCKYSKVSARHFAEIDLYIYVLIPQQGTYLCPPLSAEDGIKYRCICLPYFRSWDGGNRWDLHRTFLQFFNQPKHPCCGNILFVSRIVAGNVAPFPSREIVCRFAQRLAVNFAIFHKG